MGEGDFLLWKACYREANWDPLIRWRTAPPYPVNKVDRISSGIFPGRVIRPVTVTEW